MFRKKKFKTPVMEVIRKNNPVMMSDSIWYKLFQNLEKTVCLNDTIETINFATLCSLHKSVEHSMIILVQNNQIIFNSSDTDMLCYRMDPFSGALLVLWNYISYSNFEYAEVYEYVPEPFGETIWLDTLEQLQPNFELYNVYYYRPTLKVHSEALLVKTFKKLSPKDTIICISKSLLEREDNGKKFSSPIILRYCGEEK